MMTTQKLQTKAAPKAVQKAAPKAKTGLYAAILLEALAGKFGDNVKRFYTSAIVYHKAKKTAFPRQRLASVELMKAADFREYIAKMSATGIPAGDKKAQRVFDEMAAQAPQAFK